MASVFNVVIVSWVTCYFVDGYVAWFVWHRKYF